MYSRESEVEPSPSVSRREFLKLSVATLLALGTHKIVSALRIPEDEPTSESLPDILKEIRSKYGIYIPALAGEFTQYQACQGKDNKLEQCSPERSTQISLEEASKIQDALKLIPSVGKMVQLIIPFRNSSADAIGGGSYLGPNWDFVLDISKYQTYPQDRYLSSMSAVKLVLSNKGLNEPLPPVTQSSNFLPLLSQISLDATGISPKNMVLYPWTNYGERLTQVVIHEVAGHGVAVLARRIKVNHNPEAGYESSAMSLLGGIPLDTNNPIFSSFAKVNGWRLIPYRESMAQYGNIGRQLAGELSRTDPKMAEWPVWDRDPKYWGELRDRKIRLDTYSSYGTLHEAFANFFMFYLLSRTDSRYSPSLLTKDETQYFDRMFKGLSENPETYIKKLIAENPGPSFSPDLFEPKQGNKTSLHQFAKMSHLKYRY